MLQTNEVVKALHTLYDGRMVVTKQQKVQRSNHSTGFESVVSVSAPCRLSYKSKPATSGDPAAVTQVTVLIYDTDITIDEGSRIEVTQYGKTENYMRSGNEAVYASHKECEVILADRWA